MRLNLLDLDTLFRIVGSDWTKNSSYTKKLALVKPRVSVLRPRVKASSKLIQDRPAWSVFVIDVVNLNHPDECRRNYK